MTPCSLCASVVNGLRCLPQSWRIMAVLCLSASQSAAAIVSSSGLTLLGSPPPGNVHAGTQVTPLPILFLEVANGLVPAGDLRVDHDGSDTMVSLIESGGVVDLNLIDSTIAAGTRFDSYLFHFDPADSSFPTLGNFYGTSSIEFSTKIIGVQLFSSAFATLVKPAPTSYVGTLELGDVVISANGGPLVGYYPSTDVFRGMEEDSLAIDLSGHRIMLAGKAFGTEIDQIRIMVAAVPEPSSSLLALTCLIGMVLPAIMKLRSARKV